MSATQKPRLFSGIQPTGDLNIGNYLGAIKNWVAMQADYHCLFAIVDLHAITVRQDPESFIERCMSVLALYIACGIDPHTSHLFLQSHIPQHTQLAWVLNCYTYMGELSRMTQFKEKSRQHEANINVGLFGYPVLQAADILLYSAKKVPVGEDQKQHLELARDIAQRFNRHHGDILTVPEVTIPPTGSRIMSLQDPSKKMSKSDPNQQSAIALLDPPELITKKVKRAVTDSGGDILCRDDKPGISNLLRIFAALMDKTVIEIESEYVGKGYGDFKGDLAELIVEKLKPIQKSYHALRKDPAFLTKVLKEGAEQAQSLAQGTLEKVYQAIGLIL